MTIIYGGYLWRFSLDEREKHDELTVTTKSRWCPAHLPSTPRKWTLPPTLGTSNSSFLLSPARWTAWSTLILRSRWENWAVWPCSIWTACRPATKIRQKF